MSKTVKLKVEMTEEEFTSVKGIAGELDVGEWAKEVLLSFVRAGANKAAHSSTMNEAYRQLDVMEETGHQPIPDQPSPSPTPATAPPPKAAYENVAGHPCVFLAAQHVQNFRPGECSGVCQHGSQTGKICFWASQAANQCPNFEPRIFRPHRA